MQLLGDLERLAATTLYPLRFAIAVIAASVIVGVLVLATRRGWWSAARRHPGRTGLVLGLAVLLVAPGSWYLGSPLFLRTELSEPPPVIAAASPRIDATPTGLPAPSPRIDSTPPEATPQPPAPAPTPIILSGEFAGADDFHFGRGRATLTVAPDGRPSLRFDEFSVRNGPDLYVYLSPDSAGYADGAVEIGRLRATDGSFATPIPTGVDVSAARSVVIWCKEFAVTFAVAPLAG